MNCLNDVSYFAGLALAGIGVSCLIIVVVVLVAFCPRGEPEPDEPNNGSRQ